MRRLAAAAIAWAASAAQATDVTLVGLFPGKAVLSIDGAAPRTVTAGADAVNGVRLISTGEATAVVEFDGKRHTLSLGQHVASARAGDKQSVTLAADSRGHFFTHGQINGHSVTFLVDTGASSIALSAADAQRMRIDYRKGQRMGIQTANGIIGAWHVRLDSVRVGDIVLYQVDAVVTEASMGTTLLGNSFLNRMEMRRDGSALTLTKRF
jgi:aspartyl protease family protein